VSAFGQVAAPIAVRVMAGAANVFWLVSDRLVGAVLGLS